MSSAPPRLPHPFLFPAACGVPALCLLCFGLSNACVASAGDGSVCDHIGRLPCQHLSDQGGCDPTWLLGRASQLFLVPPVGSSAHFLPGHGRLTAPCSTALSRTVPGISQGRLGCLAPTAFIHVVIIIINLLILRVLVQLLVGKAHPCSWLWEGAGVAISPCALPRTGSPLPLRPLWVGCSQGVLVGHLAVPHSAPAPLGGRGVSLGSCHPCALVGGPGSGSL